MKYLLEIYDAGSADDPIAHLEFDQPFVAPSKGDLINAVGTEAEAMGRKQILKVVRTEHIFWKNPDDQNPCQKLCVFTTHVPNTAEERAAA